MYKPIYKMRVINIGHNKGQSVHNQQKKKINEIVNRD